MDCDGTLKTTGRFGNLPTCTATSTVQKLIISFAILSSASSVFAILNIQWISLYITVESTLHIG